MSSLVCFECRVDFLAKWLTYRIIGTPTFSAPFDNGPMIRRSLVKNGNVVFTSLAWPSIVRATTRTSTVAHDEFGLERGTRVSIFKPTQQTSGIRVRLLTCKRCTLDSRPISSSLKKKKHSLEFLQMNASIDRLIDRSIDRSINKLNIPSLC